MEKQGHTLDLGALRRLEPIDRAFGSGRGRPLDRCYIDAFLAANASDIAGRVLEVGDPGYTKRYGGARVVRSDVVDFVPTEHTTLVADLAKGEGLAGEAFDCVICPQTLQFVYAVGSAVRTIHRVLKRGGVALVTVPGISQIVRENMDREGDYWRFTTRSIERTFGRVFGARNVRVASWGNVLVAAGFLYGLAESDLTPREIAHRDPDYQVIVTVRAVKDD